MYDIRDFWAIAWRTTISITCAIIIAYLAAGFGFSRGQGMAVQAAQQAYQQGRVDGCRNPMLYEAPDSDLELENPLIGYRDSTPQSL